MINFQKMIAKLTQFWAEKGCVVHQGYDLEVGAGTFNPATFLRCLGPEPYSAVYVEPSRRPKDGRYGENPNRVQFYHQMQVILKPSPMQIQDWYLESLEAIGLNLAKHDIRFVHDDWENPTIGAWGLGWEVWLDGMEISQFTYFQAIGGLPVSPVSGEITYGLERLAMYIQGVDSMFDLKWNDDITYGDVFKRSEWEWSHYNFIEADAAMWHRHFDDFESEAKRLITGHLPIPAYDFVMKASHAFNILDARGVISVTERTGYISRIRSLAKMLAESYIQSRKHLEFPLLRMQKTKTSPPQLPSLSAQYNPTERQDFLLEIGSEELPATFVPIGMQQLEMVMRNFLKEHTLSFATLQTFGTPRRLALVIHQLASGTVSQQIERKGPALSVAFDQKGAPQASVMGFFRSINQKPYSLSEIEKGEAKGIEIRKVKETPYVFATYEQKGASTRALLAEHLPKMILNIDFPKKMRWSDLELEYARPLRWLVALYGSEVIPFALGNIVSGNTSFGHRQLSPDPFSLNCPKDYVEVLRNHFVMADVKERRTSIEEQLGKIENNLKGHAVAKEKVMAQVVHLVEWPFLTTGLFDKRFLQAPKEVLVSEMIEHQKNFPIVDTENELLPYFVIVCNNKPTELIRTGNQKALSPRLADGMFLYQQDLKTPLERFNEKLKTVTFQKDLGSVWDKVERVITNVELLHTYLPICDLKSAMRAATLCKADLVSELVGEFPELQGMIGKIYALKHGETMEVATAIDEHWMPRGEKAPLPTSACGTLLSLAEKIDNFLGCFALDLKPTSSSDPYALRRQAIGMLKMLIEGKYHVSLRSVFKEAFERLLNHSGLKQPVAQQIQAKEQAVLNDIFVFLTSRYRTIVAEYGFDKDEIEAVLSHGLDDPYALFCKLKALHAFRKSEHAAFMATHEIYTRSKKILFSQNPQLMPEWKALHLKIALNSNNRFPQVDPSFFREEIEKKLFQKIQQVKHQFHTSMILAQEPQRQRWIEAFTLLAQIREPLNTLFDSVKIIDDDASVRTNRLALLQEVWDLCEELIDFSKIQEHSD